ncbi:MAG: copper resistance protein CopC/CopD, partial [Rhodospirillales bacterium]|nr:copper resistance protein CopC/CopD [Rhodospirillales bacterium]
MRLLALLMLLLVALPGQPAAHSVLLSSEPADGAVLEAAPSRIELRFNEPVVPVSLRIVDGNGAARAVSGDAIRSDDGRVTLALPVPPLAEGQYVVSYRVVSADTHPIAGSIAFAVGTAIGEAVEALSDPALEARWSKISRANRFLRDLLLAVGCGGLFFVAWLAPVAGRTLRPALVVASAFAAVATVAGVGIAGARVALAPSLLDVSVWRIGAATSAGISALAILAGIALAMSLKRLAVVAGLVLMALGTALTGHAATGEPRWLVPIAQVAHSFAALVWIGAFVPLLCGCKRWPDDALTAAARGFSRVGVACVAVLFAAGLALAASRVELPAGLTQTGYGLLVAAKGALFALMLAFAAHNRFRALAAGRGRFARNVAFEL